MPGGGGTPGRPEAGESLSSRPAWSTEQVPGQAPKLQRNSVLKHRPERERGREGGREGEVSLQEAG